MQHDFVACVVGLSNNPKESFGTRPGVGKSCLCFRFSYPGFDRYIDSHPSVLALHEFTSPVINNTHFLYWGSPTKVYQSKGGEIRVRYHILEQTVFYQDITSRPFNALTHPDEVNYYLKRIVGSIESSGKHSYYSRDEIESSETYKKLQYPPNMSKQMRGYIVVFDISLPETELEMQLKRVMPILEFFTKTKRRFVIAATKRDSYKIMSLEKLRELHRKFHVPLIETSARENLNVDEVFRMLAKQVLGKRAQGLTDQVQSYDEAARFNLHSRGAAKRAFLSYLKKYITNCDDRLDSVTISDQYKKCAELIGKYSVDSLFVHHQLGLYNVRVDSYAGVMDDTDLRREFLEGFVDSRHDLRPFATELRG
jgi:GTPase SAR1 family protein